jgi:hypothetical protein
LQRHYHDDIKPTQAHVPGTFQNLVAKINAKLHTPAGQNVIGAWLVLTFLVHDDKSFCVLSFFLFMIGFLTHATKI